MINMEIYNGSDCREKLIKGINKVAETVGVTYGPNGKTVIIPNKNNYGKYTVTKDGVSVSESVVLADPVENIGADFIKEAAKLTVKIAGDGTTTATVLTSLLINALKAFNYKDVENELNLLIPLILEKIEKQSIPLSNMVNAVAKVSSNGDEAIAEIITKAFEFSSIVNIEESASEVDKIETLEGVKYKVPYMSQNYITNKEQGFALLQGAEVLIVDGKIEDKTSIHPVLSRISTSNSSLLIITEGLSEDVARYIEANVINGALKALVIKAPGFSTHRKNLLKDISVLTGSTIFKYPLSKNDFRFDNEKPLSRSGVKGLGLIKEVKSTSIETIIKLDEETLKNSDLTNYLKMLNTLYQQGLENDPGAGNDLIIERIKQLECTMSTIKIGGTSEYDVKERYDRYDDAVRAVQCAI